MSREIYSFDNYFEHEGGGKRSNFKYIFIENFLVASTCRCCMKNMKKTHVPLNFDIYNDSVATL